MDNADLISTMQEMMAQMARMQAELNDLKSRANGLTQPQPQPVQQINPLAATTRRKALRKMGGGLMAAGLGASLPLLTTSAAPDQQIPTPGGPFGATGPLAGPGTKGVNPNATPNIVSDGSVTQTFIGLDFKPNISGSTYGSSNFGGIYWAGVGDNSFECRLNLPQGAKVIDVTFYFTDNDASNDLGMYLVIYNLFNHDLSLQVFLTSTGTSNRVRTLSATGTAAIPVLTIDNSQNSYALGVDFYSGANSNIFWGATVTYVNILGRFKAE